MPAIEQTCTTRPRAALAHRRQREVDEVVGAGQVRGDHAVPVGRVRAPPGSRRLTLMPALQTSRSIEPKAVEHPADGGTDLFPTGDVAGFDDGGAPGVAEGRRGWPPAWRGRGPPGPRGRPPRPGSTAMARPMPLPAPVINAVSCSMATTAPPRRSIPRIRPAASTGPHRDLSGCLRRPPARGGGGRSGGRRASPLFPVPRFPSRAGFPSGGTSMSRRSGKVPVAANPRRWRMRWNSASSISPASRAASNEASRSAGSSGAPRPSCRGGPAR